MKNIDSFESAKYTAASFTKIEPGIFQCTIGYVTSLCFEQEPEMGEGSSSVEISQYPLEDILDRFNVYVSDFYKDLNDNESSVCRLEFCGSTVMNIRQLRSIIGKHVYNKEIGYTIVLVVE